MAVEFALLFPLFLVICFGTISGGILFSDKLALTQGVREGARYGATLQYESADPASFLSKVRTAAVDAGKPGQLGSGAVEYCVAIRTKDGATNWHKLAGDADLDAARPGPCPGTDDGGELPDGAHILVTVTKQAELNMLLYRFDLGVGSTSVARYEGDS